ncbi:MAG: methyl-accepting chemotaxis protein [bacterium]
MSTANLKLYNRLSFRILVSLVIMIAAIGIIMVYYTHGNINRLYESQMRLYRLHGKSLIQNSSKNLFFGVITGSTQELRPPVESLLSDPLISYAVVYGKDEKGKPEKLLERYAKERSGKDFRFPSPARADRESKPENFLEDVNKFLHDSPSKSTEEIELYALRSEDRDRYLDFVMPVYPEERFGEGSPEGWARIGMSLEGLYSEVSSTRTQGYSIIAVLVVVSLLFALWVLRRILPPINRLAEAAGKLSEGNYNVQVDATTRDEIGLLTETFNHMAINIRNQTGRLESVIENVREAIELLTSTSNNLLGVTSEQSSGATEQATVVQEVVSSAEEVASSASKIAETAGLVSQASNQTSEAAHQGKELIDNSLQSMEQIRSQVEKGSFQIRELVEEAKNIGGVIDIIEEISDQTELLALNAAIEAAGAGDAGRRFSVVAEEVRRLANRTQESTGSVRQMVETIQSSTNQMAMLAEDEQKDVAQGVDLVRKMEEFFQHILELVESTREAGSEISLITQQQSGATQQMVSSVQEVEKVAKEVENGVKEIESSMEELSALAERLKGLVYEEAPGPAGEEEKADFSPAEEAPESGE